MAYDNQNGGGFQKQMYDVNEKCSKCGTDIKQLPFQPSPERREQLLCRDCHRESRPARDNRDRGGFQRQMYQGNWECSECGGSITELPFNPTRTENLKCRDCFRSNR